MKNIFIFFASIILFACSAPKFNYYTNQEIDNAIEIEIVFSGTYLEKSNTHYGSHKITDTVIISRIMKKLLTFENSFQAKEVRDQRLIIRFRNKDDLVFYMSGKTLAIGHRIYVYNEPILEIIDSIETEQIVN